jgi:hypothetical protein
VGSEAKPDRIGCRFGIRAFGVDRRPTPVLGAVRGRASRDGEGSWRLRGMLDGGDELQGAAALGTVFHIDLEHPLTKALPGFRPSDRRSPFKTTPVGFVNGRAQLIRAGAKGGGGSWSAEGVLALTGAVGKGRCPLGFRTWPSCGRRV